MKRLFSLALTALLALPATAAKAGDPLADLVTLEVLDGGLTRNGTYQAAFRLTLKEGWKTYWRAPGDAGIPPSFGWKGSRNLGGIAITWPTPEVFETSGFRTIGYHDQLVLPFEITPQKDGQPMRLKGRIDLGICKDICVPSQLRFDHNVDLAAARHPAIAAALASRPYTAAEAGVRGVSCHLSPTASGMQVEARITLPHAGGQEVAVIEPSAPEVYAGETTAERSGNTLIATTEFHPAAGNVLALDRSRLRITVIGARHAVDIHGCSAG